MDGMSFKIATEQTESTQIINGDFDFLLLYKINDDVE